MEVFGILSFFHRRYLSDKDCICICTSQGDIRTAMRVIRSIGGNNVLVTVVILYCITTHNDVANIARTNMLKTNNNNNNSPVDGDEIEKMRCKHSEDWM